MNAINLANKLQDAVPSSIEEAERLVPKDETGESTIAFLRRIKRIAVRIVNRSTTDHMASLDLHPFVYFYADNSRHRPSTFLAMIELIADYEDKNKFKDFTLIRKEFEDFLVVHNDLLQQVSRHARGEMKAVHKIKAFLDFVIEQLKSNNGNAAAVLTTLQESKEFNFLRLGLDEPQEVGREFSTSIKSKSFIAEKLQTAIRCKVCGARVPDRGVSFDHKQDKELGGVGDEANLQFTHHYCNASKRMLAPLFAAKEERQLPSEMLI